MKIDNIKIVKHEEKVKVYNFTVAEFHTYYVTDIGIWVHNTDCGWSMARGGDTINGRKYSEHALERMAPNTIEVRAELTTRAKQSAQSKGLIPGTKEYNDYIKKYVDSRGFPPMVMLLLLSLNRRYALCLQSMTSTNFWNYLKVSQ
ncbi:hypothetical protein PAECIP111893_00307 [Paenibacillus plantiphilus]|uniref:Intein C-terminal splicing domain-containing protein n=1 Tax=Paenibacillus plantiphilus TaxID=2905650 RepID=A0ABN8FXF2_9BACL|nr:hypothetical protein PAECIP111893_00307 [Paenibacillus plantiphilus]